MERIQPVGKPPPGHLWRWQLKPIDDETTSVTHTYDWTRLDPEDAKRNERARSTTAESLQASLDLLADLIRVPADAPESPAADEATPNIVRRADAPPLVVEEPVADEPAPVDTAAEEPAIREGEAAADDKRAADADSGSAGANVDAGTAAATDVDAATDGDAVSDVDVESATESDVDTERAEDADPSS